ncbi:MAG: threo-3-hydroxy-L-aspartate ammonia-lyase [Bacteroidetes bacterium]|nr:threo-3-hydroxy-L-aspartate ammonia-lyase [Bacteroidota bacterium]
MHRNGQNHSVPKEESIPPVVFSDILSAAEQIAGKAHQTPIITSQSIDVASLASVFLKPENFQRTGAFKFRGAYNAMSRLTPTEQAAGVLTFSSGNHAQAIALSGRLLGIRTTIIMPSDAPTVKKKATLAYGAEIISYDKFTASREELATQVASERSLTLIPPYDHPHVVAGQGTAGLELIQGISNLDYLFVPCGGGGLLSGCAIASKALQPNCKVIGVEPATADDATRSFYSGTLQSVHNPDTIADGARTPYLGTITFPLVRKYVDAMITVSDEEIVEAMELLWNRTKMIVEPTGAMSMAGVLSGKIDVRGARVGVILSGGNVDLASALTLLTHSREA